MLRGGGRRALDQRGQEVNRSFVMVCVLKVLPLGIQPRGIGFYCDR